MPEKGPFATVKYTDQLHARDRFSVILGYQLLFIFEGSIATVKYTDQLHARDRFSGILGYQLLFIFEGPIAETVPCMQLISTFYSSNRAFKNEE
jgi:hypothetical protein